MGRNKSAADTLLRQWHMLRAVPRHPRRITVGEIKQSLDAAGFEVSSRTIQRDLMELSDEFPLYSDERERPFGWSWQARAAVFDLPNLSNQEALAFAMLEDYLRPLLPHMVLDELRPHFMAAKKRLAAGGSTRGSTSWLGKVAVVPPTQPLISPKVDTAVQAAVTDALLHDQRLRIKYRKKGEHRALDYVLSPLGLILRGQVTYVVGLIAEYDDVRTFALHRVERAQLLEDAARRPKNFSLEAYLATGALHFGAGDRIQLEAFFNASAAEHLSEAPLSEDQRLTVAGDDRVRVRATVIDTPQLRWWLLAFGDGVEIKAPAQLRRTFTKIAASMAASYVAGETE